MSTERRRFVSQMAAAGAGLLMSGSSAAGRQGGVVRCRVVDERSGQLMPARVRLMDAQGNEVVPVGHPAALAKDAQEGDVRFQSRRFAYVDGSFEIASSALPLKYQVIKGYEYLFAEGELAADKLRDGAFTIPLSRWSEVSRQGW